MPATLTYPGVYIEEVPSGVRPIAGVATSVAAFVDLFRRGPVDRAVQLLGMADFERIFGGIDPRSEASYAISQYFQNGGTEAWAVRVVTSGASPADQARRASVHMAAASGGAAMLELESSSEGVWANDIGVAVQSAPAAGELDLTISLYQKAGGREVVVAQELFRNLSMSSTALNYIRRILEDEFTGSKLIRTTGTPGATRPLTSGTLSDVVGATISVTSGNQALDVTIGTIGPVTLTLPLGAHSLDRIAAALEDALRTARPTEPSFASATVRVHRDSAGPHLLVRSGTALTRIVFAQNGSSTAAGDLQLLAADGATINVQEYRLGQGAVATSAQVGGTAGQDGLLPSSAALIGSPSLKTGMQALEDVDLFNLLCIPRTAMVDAAGANQRLTPAQAQAVIAAATALCERRRAFFLLDTPIGVDDPAEIKTWLQSNDSLRHKNLALYYPRLMIPDPSDEFRPRSFGASGTVAGLFARIDTERGVWKAPAGIEATLRNVTRLEDVLTDPENGTLNPLAINCLRTMPIYGTISWGARTLVGADAQASEWKYIPVRRLALFLEESLFRGLKWVVFEPNDEPLWAQIRFNVGAFMQTLFRRGAFAGASPQQAYFVKCDATTTTQAEIDAGIVNIVVGFAPLKPAEFVVIKIQQIAGQEAV